jgi:hypothetical protein
VYLCALIVKPGQVQDIIRTTKSRCLSTRVVCWGCWGHCEAHACVVRYDQVMDIIKTTKSRCVGISVSLGCEKAQLHAYQGVCVLTQ